MCEDRGRQAKNNGVLPCWIFSRRYTVIGMTLSLFSYSCTFLSHMTLTWYHVMNVNNGFTSNVCILKHHLQRHGFVQIVNISFFQCKLLHIKNCVAVAFNTSIHLQKSLTPRSQWLGYHRLLGVNDSRGVISSRGESLASRSEWLGSHSAPVPLTHCTWTKYCVS